MPVVPSVAGISLAVGRGRAGGFRAAVALSRTNFRCPARCSGCTKYPARDASIPSALAPFYRARDYSAAAGVRLSAPRTILTVFPARGLLSASVGDALNHGYILN